MLELFHRSGHKSQEQVQQLAHEVDHLRGDLTVRLQQVEEECARIPLQRMLRGIHNAAELAVQSGVPGPGARGDTAMAPSCPGRRNWKPIVKNTSGTRPVDEFEQLQRPGSPMGGSPLIHRLV